MSRTPCNAVADGRTTDPRLKTPGLQPSEAEIRMSTRAKRAWQNVDVRSGDSKQQHPNFVPQGQISQKPLRKDVLLIMHTQSMGCY